MSQVIDRLDEMAALCPPLPWPLAGFCAIDGSQFAFLYGLTQAYPALRDEVRLLEEKVATFSEQLASETLRRHESLAEAVCRSIGPIRSGAHLAMGQYDGAALDAWRRS